jgi:hypothetical protein
MYHSTWALFGKPVLCLNYKLENSLRTRGSVMLIKLVICLAITAGK